MHDATLTHRLLPRSARFSSVKTGWSLGLVLLVASILFVPFARALDDADTPDGSAAAGNGRAVRLSFVEGGVRVTQGDQVIADPAVVNMPLFEGTQVATDNDGRAEIQLEDGSIVRLSPNTTIDFTVMQMQGTVPRTEITLGSGLAYFEMQPSNAEHRLRVRYDDASVTASEPSIVRITHDTPPAELAVLSGNVHLERASALQLDLHAGESLTLDAATQSRYNLATSITPNSWDNWNADRDQLLSSEAADQTSATANQHDYPNSGLSDLDANGNWYNVPGEGYVWAPYEAQGAGEDWDPYGYGNWVDYPQYGYVWVSGYPWGYSPFACGLWDYYEDFGWAWAPGNGCSPWWGYGGGSWVYRIGRIRPPGYHPPHRPRPPLRTSAGPVRAVRHDLAGIHPGPASPVIRVDHRPGGGGPTPIPRQGGEVTIAGHPVEPLRPIGKPAQGFRTAEGNRSGDDSNGGGIPNGGYILNGRPTPGNPSNRVRPVYTPPRSGLEGGQPGVPSSGSRPMPARPMPSRPVTAPPPPPRYSPPPAPHYSAPPPPPPHVSSPPPAAHPHH